MQAHIKPVEFFGSALSDLRDFPLSVRREAGYQIDKVQHGGEPDDWKPIKPSELACRKSGFRMKQVRFG